jgi:hypothetical protein
MCGYGICETNTSPSNTDDLLEWSVRSGGGGGGHLTGRHFSILAANLQPISPMHPLTQGLDNRPKYSLRN